MQERHVETEDIQLDTASSTGKEQTTNLVAYMTTVSEEIQNGVDEEDMHHCIPDESDEYSYAYMDVKGQVDIHMALDIQQSGNQTSEEYCERIDNESEKLQPAYTGLVLEEVDKETPMETTPHIYTQLKQDNRSNKQ